MRWVEAHRFFECAEGAAQILFREPEVPAHQVAAVGFQVAGLRARASGPLTRGQPGLDGFDDARGDLVLNRKNVRGFAVIALRPELVAARHVGQLRGDPNPAARRAHAAIENVAHR